MAVQEYHPSSDYPSKIIKTFLKKKGTHQALARPYPFQRWWKRACFRNLEAFFLSDFLRELPELFLNLDSGPPSEFLPHFSLQQPVASGKLTLCYANHEFTVVWKGDLHSYVKLLVWRKPWKGVRFYESWLLVMDIPWYFIRFLY